MRRRTQTLRLFPGGFSMKTVVRLVKANLSLSLTLCLIAASSLYLLIQDASAANKRSATKTKVKTSRLAKARRGAPRAKKRTPVADPPIAEPEDGSRSLISFEPVNPLREKIGEWPNDAGSFYGAGDGPEQEAERADEPDKAMQYFLQKRLPEGET